MRRWVIAAVLPLSGVLLFAAAQPAGAFCGSLCNPQAAALAVALQNGSAQGVTIAGSVAAVAPVGVATTTSGSILGVSVTGGVAAAAAGLSILAGGLPDWIWSPDADVIATNADLEPGPVYAGHLTGGWTVDPGTTNGIFVDTTNAIDPVYGAGAYYVQFYYRAIYWAGSGPAPGGGYVFQACPEATGSSTFAPCTDPNLVVAYQNTSTYRSTSFYPGLCPAQPLRCDINAGEPAYIQILQRINNVPTHGKFSQYTINPPGVRGSTLTGTLVSEITCWRPDGTVQAVVQSTPVTGLAAGGQLGVQPSVCPPGDWVQGVSVELETSTGTIGLVDTDADWSPGWERMPNASRTLLVDPDSTNEVRAPQPTLDNPEPITVVRPVPSPVPGGDGPGDSSCDLGWGDVLSGTIFYEATGCALSWAFIPSDSLMDTQTQALSDTWGNSAIGTLVNNVAYLPVALGSFGQGPTNCAGPTITIPLGSFSQEIEPLNACEEPMATVAHWVYLGSFVVMAIGSAIFIVNPILSGLRLVRMPEVSGFEEDGQGRLF